MKFKDLIQTKKIEIPLIQRDYVQGLEEKKAKKFLEAIKSGLDGQGLNLDFIYGNEKDSKFIPIDGQQRLTTLFLIYYYLSLKEENYLEELRNFTYAIRPTSKEFFTALTKKENWETLKNKTDIVKEIKNSNWYFLSWENDLTVKSALKMLEFIEKEFKNYKLSDLDQISFEFLNMEDYSLNEDLYIKMNARGKQLSDFENFKAEFEKYIKNPRDKAKLDNKWLDVFWNLDYENVDKLYYNFFFNTTFIFYIEENDIDKNFLKEKELLDFYKNVYDNADNVNRIIKLLDNINDYSELKEYCNISDDPAYYKKLNFYIWTLGVLKDFDNIQMPRWKRIANNLVKNTRIEDIDTFIGIVRELLKLIDTIQKDVYKEIDFSNIQKFYSEQIKEEKLKIELINANPQWEDELTKAENHWYLDGQVGFLIEYSNEIIGNFIIYRDKLIKLWNFTKDNENKSIKKNEILIHRALLTFGDYIKLTKHGNKYTFCTFGTGLREKSENWRKVFGSDLFKRFLDSIKTTDNLNLKLKKLINSYKFNCNDWKSYIINPDKDWSVLDETKHYQIQFYEKNTIKNKNDIICLNRGSVIVTSWQWRKFYDLYDYYLYRVLKYEKEIIKNTNFKRIEPFAAENYPGFYIDGYETKNHHYALDIFFEPKTSKFLIRFFDRSRKSFFPRLKIFLKNNKFQDNKYKTIREHGYWNDEYDLCQKEKLMDFLERFLTRIENNL